MCNNIQQSDIVTLKLQVNLTINAMFLKKTFEFKSFRAI